MNIAGSKAVARQVVAWLEVCMVVTLVSGCLLLLVWLGMTRQLATSEAAEDRERSLSGLMAAAPVVRPVRGER